MNATRIGQFVMQSRLTGVGLGLTTWMLVAGCQSTPEPPRGSAAPPPSPKIKYNAELDVQIKEVFELAGKGEWELAEYKAETLYQKAPESDAVKRLRDWVTQQREIQRERALEDKIREIDAKHSVFNPSLVDLATEKKDRGLPPRKDIRNAVEQIEKAPYIPDTYGKKIHRTGQLFWLDSTNSRMAQVLQKEVNIHLDNVPLETIVLNVGQTAGVNFVADKSLPALKQVLTINLEKVKLGEFLKYVGRNYELQFQVGEDLVWITDGKDPKKLMEETRFYRLRKGFVLPARFGSEDVVRQRITANNVTTETETQKFKKFVNDEAPETPAIEEAIKELFLGSKYLIDYERNLIVARGTPEQLEVIEQIIAEFDRTIQQVLIEARFITVSKPAFLQLGVIWETGRTNPAARTPQDFTALIGAANVRNVGIGIQETFTNILDRATLSATISALEQSGESHTLSAPRLTVLNNRPATISDGKVQYYYEEYTVQTTTTERTVASAFVPEGKPTKITAGAELEVLASVSGDGQSILLALNPRVNTEVVLSDRYVLEDPSTGTQFKIWLPEYRTQELATRVVVKSGETVVMGGVLEREQTTYVESVPVLGNLPIIGALFRRRTELDRPRYLLIFVTATIVSESGEFVVYDTTSPGTRAAD